MSLAKKTAVSSIWLLILSFVQKGAGLISTLILARILTPEDFGIVAVVTLVYYFFDSLSISGSMKYIIQKDDVTENDLNTAWTINILQRGFFFLVFILSTPYIADYFGDQRLVAALYVISCILPITACSNTGVYLYRKALNFKPIVRLGIIQKLIAVPSVIVMAVILESYWAMVIGLIISPTIVSIGSYIIHPHRPKLHFKQIKQQWSFSQWIFFQSVIGYSRSQIDSILIAKFFDAAGIGAYNLMKNLAYMPAGRIIGPATTPLLSSFSLSKNNMTELNHRLNISLLVVLILISPVSAFMYFFSEQVIMILVGAQWIQYSGIFQVFAIGMVGAPIGAVLGHYLTALGKVKTLFIFDVLSAILSLTLLITFRESSLVFLAALTVSVSLFSLVVTFLYIKLTMKTNVAFIISMFIYYMSAAFAVAYFTMKIIWSGKYPLIIEFVLAGIIFGGLYLLAFLLSLLMKNKFKEMRFVFEKSWALLEALKTKLLKRNRTI